MIVIAIVSLCLPLILNFLSKYIIDCITRNVEVEHFIKNADTVDCNYIVPESHVRNCAILLFKREQISSM